MVIIRCNFSLYTVTMTVTRNTFIWVWAWNPRMRMHHNNLTIVYDNYYGGETPVMRFAEVGIDSMCTVNKSAVSHVFEKRESDETYKSGAKAGERKLIPALQPGEFRTAATTATVHDSRTGAARVIQVRTAAGRHVERSAARSECR